MKQEKLKILLVLLFLIIGVNYFPNEINKLQLKTNDELIEIEKEKEWNYLILSIIHIESKGDNFAIGQLNSIGCLQITPIYVKEVNRILKNNEIYKKYELIDRLSRKKSIEMFNIMNNHYNPNKNINKAIKMHNPRAPKSYRNKILIHMTNLYNL